MRKSLRNFDSPLQLITIHSNQSVCNFDRPRQHHVPGELPSRAGHKDFPGKAYAERWQNGEHRHGLEGFGSPLSWILLEPSAESEEPSRVLEAGACQADFRPQAFGGWKPSRHLAAFWLLYFLFFLEILERTTIQPFQVHIPPSPPPTFDIFLRSGPPENDKPAGTHNKPPIYRNYRIHKLN